jgi:putative ABC transport system permease protein
MFRNHIKIAIRNLVKFKGYAAINIAGLAIGVAACLLILQYVTDELSFDQHHANGGQIYRVDTEFFLRNSQHKSGATPAPLGWAMKKDFPEVTEATRIYKVPHVDKFLLKYEDQSFFEKRGIFADSNFFEVLTYEFIKGDQSTALDQPFSVVISDKISQKLFGNEEAIGKTIQINTSWGEDDFQITGVFDSEKYRSHLDGSFYISGMSGRIGRRFYRLQEWGGNNLYFTYIQLQNGTNPETINDGLPKWLEGYAGERFRELGMNKKHYLTLIGDVYLKAEGGNWFGGKGDISFIYILIVIAAFILLIACINFMNLATAKATLRAKEVGVRKVIGASRSMLVKQFMSEAFVYATIAVVIAYVISELTLPVFNQLTAKELSMGFFTDLNVILWLIGFILITTFVAGSYPALYLSSFSPIKIFRNNLGNKSTSRQVRKGLVVLQFIISIALIQGVLVINEQMNFIRNKNLGFNPEAKVVVTLNTDESHQNYETLRNELLKNNQIHEVGASSSYPGEANIDSYFFFKDGQSSNEGFHCFNSTITPEFMEMMDFELLAGRLFNRNRIADTVRTTVISEKTMEGMDFTLDNVLGENINFEWDGQRYSFKIIGVIKDYHASSLHSEIEGQTFDWSPAYPTNYVIASVDTKNLPNLLSQMETKWNEINPEEPFEFQFLEDRLQQNYETERRMSGLIFSGTLLAIFISCLGLLGLAAFAAERRQKEIGVRKVLGATVTNIVTLLSKDFLVLILIALIIAIPLSWHGMNQWLKGFAYRIDIQWWMFALAGFFALTVTILTVGFQGVKAALANPIQSLRSE